MREHQSPGEDREESVQSFSIEVGPDGVARTIGMTETFSNGSMRHVAHEQVASDDPYVRHRERIAGEEPTSELSTTFAPSQVRPRTYPEGMPFLVGRESRTTESPSGTRSTGVRWRCTDSDVLQRALHEAIVSDGWEEALLSAAPSFVRAGVGHVYTRGRMLRTVTRHDFGSGSVVDLSELDSDFLK